MTAVIRGYLEKVHVRFNGDRDASKNYRENTTEISQMTDELKKLTNSFDKVSINGQQLKRFENLERAIETIEEGDNTLLVSLIHPGGNGSTNVIKPLRLGNGRRQGYTSASKGYFDSGLFKTIAIGEFGVRATIMDTDRVNRFTRFFRRVLKGAFNTVTSSSIDDIGNVIVASAADELSSDIANAIGRSDTEKTQVVGVSPMAKFFIGTNSQLEITNEDGDLEFTKGKLTLPLSVPGRLQLSRHKYATPGSPNGSVVIRLESESIA